MYVLTPVVWKLWRW